LGRALAAILRVIFRITAAAMIQVTIAAVDQIAPRRAMTPAGGGPCSIVMLLHVIVPPPGSVFDPGPIVSIAGRVAHCHQMTPSRVVSSRYSPTLN
jgi:hypothetical protein